MGTLSFPENKQQNNIDLFLEEEEEDLSHECKQLLLTLPRERGWRTQHLYKFQGFWCQPKQIQSIMSFQRHFKAQDTDVVLASIPKSGTTWLKALAFAILRRKQFPVSHLDHPLLTSNPHDLVPFFEYRIYLNHKQPADLSNVPQPRLFATHVPISSLEDSILTSNCKIVYICRNPFDTFISSWHYTNKIKPKSVEGVNLEEGFKMYCDGVIGCGPFWDHMLGYWGASLEKPDKVMFLKYEDVKEDVVPELKKLAAFLGVPFSAEEEDEGVIEKIAELCSFEKMKDLEVNKTGKAIMDFENKNLFRKAEVGDWTNYLSPLMVEQLSKVLEEKLGGSGLMFKSS